MELSGNYRKYLIMNIPYCENKSPRKLCEAIEAVLPADAGRLIRRPYNHFQPTMTSWWLVPSNELPFFKFGKFGFNWDEKKRETISCGLYLTKGLDPALKQVYPSKKGGRLIMDETWAWHNFAESCRNGKIPEAIKAAAGESMVIEAVIEGGYVDDPGLFDPQVEHPAMDCYTLSFDVKTGAMRVTKAKRAVMAIKELNKVSDLPSFCKTIDTLGNNQFLWMNVFIGAVFSVKEYGEFSPEDNVISASQIWEKVLCKFLPWIK